MIEIVGGVIAIILLLLGFYLKGRIPPKQRTEYEKDIESFDKYLTDGDTLMLSDAFEQLRKNSGCDPKRQGDKTSP